MSDPRDALYSTPAMAAVMAPANHVRQLLAFEAALARAEARAGVIPPAAADAIADACKEGRFDVADIFARGAAAGTLVFPLVQDLTAQVAAAGRPYVHWGATSQDAIDTALMLQLREGLALLEADLLRLCAACARLAAAHRATLMAGRTLLQQALPIPFGLKAARWLALATRQAQALRAQRAGLTAQLGGAAGTLAALGHQGLAVAALLAEELGLASPDLPWHAERDRLATLASALAVAAGSMAKIAQDLLLLAQTEVGEAAEAPATGKGASSAMPQKRNPVDASLALAAARLAMAQLPPLLGAMAQEHERAPGGLQIEWQATQELARYTAGAVARAADAVAGLQVDQGRMAANLALGGGLLLAESLTMALAPSLGRPEAQRVVRELVVRSQADGVPFNEAARCNERVRAALSAEAIERALDPAAYLGSADALIDRALAAYALLAQPTEQ
jgi:3-carboxy-cis,cis-muconate cycloisomerase